jgi:hypothetical protein
MSYDDKYKAVLDELRTLLGPNGTDISSNDIIDVNLFNHAMTKLFNNPMKKRTLDISRCANVILVSRLSLTAHSCSSQAEALQSSAIRTCVVCMTGSSYNI